MNRILMTVPLMVLVGTCMMAQYAPGSAPRSYTQGNVLYPGGVPPQTLAGSPVLPMGGYGQPQSHGAGSRGYQGGGRILRPPHPAHANYVVVPVYIGGGGAGYSELAAEPLQQQQEPPVVIINQAYRPESLNPSVRDYSDVPLPEAAPFDQRQAPPTRVQQPDPSPTIYLIALNDGSIVAALGYWLEGDTLNYVTRDANRNRVSMDRVDREFSIKLNSERQVEFKLP